jgi:hypothetical protein
MTLKLVADSTVVPLDVPNYADVPSCLRRLADEIEAGTHGDVFRTIALIEREHGLGIIRLGRDHHGIRAHGIIRGCKAQGVRRGLRGR